MKREFMNKKRIPRKFTLNTAQEDQSGNLKASVKQGHQCENLQSFYKHPEQWQCEEDTCKDFPEWWEVRSQETQHVTGRTSWWTRRTPRTRSLCPPEAVERWAPKNWPQKECGLLRSNTGSQKTVKSRLQRGEKGPCGVVIPAKQSVRMDGHSKGTSGQVQADSTWPVAPHCRNFGRGFAGRRKMI